jgi:hypothetical protein
MEPVQDEPTIGKLVNDASKDISTLISQEIQLAKSELAVSFKNGGVGVGLFAGAAALVLIAVILASMTIAYFIHMTGLDLAWSFLIVTLAYILIAAVFVFIGVRKVKKVRGPERAISQARASAESFRRV